jgi:hypothetical protein
METLKLEPYNGGDFLTGIFKYQTNLINQYHLRGMVPAMPLDLNDRESQRFIKKLVSDMLEELVEANTQYETNILGFWNENGHKLVKESAATFDIDAWQELKKAVVNYTEELADVIHFFVEIMIYSNIGPEDVTAYQNREGLLTGQLLGNSVRRMNNEASLVVLKLDSFRMYSNMERSHDIKDDYPGTNISPGIASIMEVLSYRILSKSKAATHKLKNKDWKQTEIGVQAMEYQSAVMEAWVAICDYMCFVGMSEKRMYLAYEEKNLVNQKRLQDGY